MVEVRKMGGKWILMVGGRVCVRKSDWTNFCESAGVFCRVAKIKESSLIEAFTGI
jgi:hypothetical protein